MPLLLLFAFIAGAGTAITPCVLPVLPALLSASAAGGRRRPIGIVIGLAVTFTIAIVALAQLVKGVGLAAGAARTLAIIVLIVFGVVLLIPELAERVQAPLSRLARFGPKTRGDGFISGLAVGGALGFVCAPCAGPILAAVTSVSASSGATTQVVAVALAYAVGPQRGDAALRPRRPRRPGPRQAARHGPRGRALPRRGPAHHRRSSWSPTSTSASRRRWPRTRACRRSWSTPPARWRTPTRSRTGWHRCDHRRGSRSVRSSRR